MTEPFTFSVHGTPRPQPRPRFVRGKVVSTANRHTKLWRGAVASAIYGAMKNRGDAAPLFTGAVRVRLVFTFVPPAGARDRIGKPHTQKPDCDNASKNILDEMEKAGVFKNDSQAAAAPPEKWWGERAGVAVLVESMEGERREMAAPVERPSWLT